jgi:hypothetical protein
MTDFVAGGTWPVSRPMLVFCHRTDAAPGYACRRRSAETAPHRLKRRQRIPPTARYGPRTHMSAGRNSQAPVEFVIAPATGRWTHARLPGKFLQYPFVEASANLARQLTN